MTCRVLKLICSIFFWRLCTPVFSQHENDNWYFGRRAALSFTQGGSPSVRNDSKMDTRNSGGSTCISDAVRGQLLLYSDGETVWNRKHAVMKNGNNICNQALPLNTIVAPFPGSKTRYIIFSITQSLVLSFAVIDMTGDNALGEVVEKQTALYSATPLGNGLAIVKKPVHEGFWLITHEKGTNKFLVFEVTKDGVQTTPVQSSTGLPCDYYGTITTDNAGNRIVATHDFNNNGITEIFNFDKFCGKVSDALTLPKLAAWNRSFGAAFSPDNQLLYVAYLHSLVQYPLANPANYTPIANTRAGTATLSFNSLLLGPDGKIYVREGNTFTDAIQFPDSLGNACGFKADVLDLGVPDSDFPTIILDKSIAGAGIRAVNTCQYDTVKFSFSSTAAADSLRWNFGDTLSLFNTSTLANTEHRYPKAGTYTVNFYWYACGLTFSESKSIEILLPKPVSIGPDTTLCYGEKMELSPGISGAAYLWSNSSTAEGITVEKGGRYWVQVSNGRCSGADTVTIKQLQPILVELGGDYGICDDENELQKLDAGKGYAHYLWTPTGDTTQWIIVNKVGDYYVVVQDYHGCKGDDNTTINRLCNYSFYLPNAFTPDGNTVNDVFAPVFSDIHSYYIEIYNCWGQRIFTSDNPSAGWDGTCKGSLCPAGVYSWRASFKGYQNRVYRNYNLKGNVTLIR